MTQEKNLLLRYLCMALPYGVKIKFAFNKDIERDNNLIYVSDNELSYTHNSCMVLTEDNIKYVFNGWLDECKPYLRPMSSMTEEERKEVGNLIKENRPNPYGIINNKGIDNLLFSVSITSSFLIDWLNTYHFDFMGLIPKGLALEAPEGMYEKGE